MSDMFRWLAVLGRMSNLYADQCLKPYGINSSHHPFVINICRQPGVTQESLRTMVHVHPSNITRALDHLEEKGFITREPLPEDKRTCRLYPTQKARDILPHIQDTVDNWADLVTRDMTGEERETFNSLLRRAGAEATGYFFGKD